MDLSNLREEYVQERLSFDKLLPHPIDQFEIWFKAAQEAGLLEPNAMSLATIAESNIPNIRTVLLKLFDYNGFVFFTNYSSNKAKEMETNEHVAVLFPWIALERQIKIRGRIEKISKMESVKYFMSRPRSSQLGAWVSNQSSIISSRRVLMDKLTEIKEKFLNKEIPFPDFWGGYRIVPFEIEFWQGGEHRLHDRFVYIWNDEIKEWKTSIIAP